MNLLEPLPKIDHGQVVAAIAAAELLSSGEVRAVISRSKTTDPIASAQKHFDKLGMTNTRQRNGVLIFVAPRSRNFAIIGDSGIHEKCGDSFWKLVAAEMEAHFRRGEFTEGLVRGIDHAGKILAENFPRTPDDKNELPDKVEEAD